MTPTPDPDKATPSPAVEAEVAPRELDFLVGALLLGEPVVNLRETCAHHLTRLASEKARLEREVWDAAKAMSDINREAVAFSDRAERAEAERDALKARAEPIDAVLAEKCGVWHDDGFSVFSAERVKEVVRMAAHLSALKQRVAEVLSDLDALLDFKAPAERGDPWVFDDPSAINDAMRRAAELHASLTQERK